MRAEPSLSKQILLRIWLHHSPSSNADDRHGIERQDRVCKASRGDEPEDLVTAQPMMDVYNATANIALYKTVSGLTKHVLLA